MHYSAKCGLAIVCHLSNLSICLSVMLVDHDQTHTHTTVLRLYGLCLGQPGWASTRRNIHPLTPIVVINCPLYASSNSIYYDPMHPSCSIHTPDNLFPQSLSKSLWSTSWPDTLHFILHTFLHPIIVLILINCLNPNHFRNTCPYYRNLFRCSTEIMSSNPSLSTPYLEFCLVISRHTSI